MKHKAALSTIMLFITLSMLVMSVYAWFIAGDSIYDIFVHSGAADFEVELFWVDDFNFDGVVDGDFSREGISLMLSQNQSASSTSFGGMAKDIDEDGSKISNDVVFTKTDIGYTISGKDNLAYDNVSLRKIANKNETITEYLKDMYPTKALSFAVAVINKNTENDAEIDFLVSKSSQEQGVTKLADVTTINLCGTSRLLYDDSYVQDTWVSAFDESAQADKPVAHIKQTVWIFFTLRFESLDRLQILNSAKFGAMSYESFQMYQNLPSATLPPIRLNYRVLPSKGGISA